MTPRRSVELRRHADGLELAVGGEVVATSRDVDPWLELLEGELAPVALVVGLGLGGLVSVLLARPELERLVVVEQLAEVAALFGHRHPQLAADPRLELVVGTYPACVALESWVGLVLDARAHPGRALPLSALGRRRS